MQSRASASKEFLKIKIKDALFLEVMKIKLNRHQELRFVVVGVAPTAFTCMYHLFNCDKILFTDKIL